LDFNEIWSIDSLTYVISSTPFVAPLRLTGREVCPQNDATVYIKLDPQGDNVVGEPLFWTQVAGTNSLLFQGAVLPASIATAVAGKGFTDLFASSVQDADICFSVIAPDAVDATGSYWRVPFVAGQEIFWAAPLNSATSKTIIGAGSVGYTPFNNGVQDQAIDLSSSVTLYTINTGSTIASAALVGDLSTLRVFAFDHVPLADEFVEREEDLKQYPFGVCGSYAFADDGSYAPQEWRQHPYDCTDQLGGATCMYCKGRANDQVKAVCLERLGSGCNAAFNTAARYAFCNLEFECPASQFSFSLVLVALALCLASIF